MTLADALKVKSREDRMKTVIGLFDKCILDAASILKVIKDEMPEPCKHEPRVDFKINIYGQTDKFITFEDFQDFLKQTAMSNWECKHCGAKIRAKEWVAE